MDRYQGNALAKINTLPDRATNEDGADHSCVIRFKKGELARMDFIRNVRVVLDQ